MIAIDQLCYRSKLRYHNAGEKFAFTTLTLLFCVVSRSVVIAGIVLVTTGFSPYTRVESLFSVI